MAAELEFKLAPEPQESHEPEVHQVSPEVESEARQFGWRPKEEFNGPEDNWVDAETFVKRGREITPLLKENNRKLLSELKTARSEVNELKLTVKEFGEMYTKMAENAYKKAIADVKTQIRNAQQEGDYDLVEQLQDQQEQLKEDSKNVKVPQIGGNPQANEAQAKWDGIVQDWQEANPWYEKDRVLARQMNAIAAELAQKNPRLLGNPDLLEKAAEILKEDMPEKFKNTRRSSGSPVSGSEESSSGSTRSRGKSSRDLPAEAKQAGERMVKQGLFKNIDEYATAYFDQ